MTGDQKVWLVRATDPGFEQFEEHGIVALNCKIDQSVAAMTREQILAVGASKQHAAELARIHDIAPGDLIVATDSGHPREILVGTVDDLYEHRPGLIDNHPHVFAVSYRGRIRREVLTECGVRWKRAPVAIAEWDAPAAAREVVARIASGDLTAPVASTPRARQASRPQEGGVACGDELLASVRRRSDGPVSWIDAELAREERADPCPIGRCDMHTKHRYWLDLAPHADPRGPNVLIVGVNPTCPDVPHPRNTTFQQARRLARGLGAASCALVNLATRRTANQDELLMVSDGDIVGQRQDQMLRRALAQADLVVLAYGRLPGPVGELLRPHRDHLMRLVDDERGRGLTVAQITDFARHPRSWTAVQGDESSLVAALCAVAS